jgi:hypothetical protein
MRIPLSCGWSRNSDDALAPQVPLRRTSSSARAAAGAISPSGQVCKAGLTI